MSNTYIIKTRFTFPKKEHLKSRKAIEQLFKTGQSFFVHPYKVFYQNVEDENNLSVIQTGFAVSSRNFKRAVDRNRIKRLGREAYRLHKNLLWEQLQEKKAPLQVFFVFTDKTLPTFELVERKMKVCLNKLIAVLEK